MGEANAFTFHCRSLQQGVRRFKPGLLVLLNNHCFLPIEIVVASGLTSATACRYAFFQNEHKRERYKGSMNRHWQRKSRIKVA